MALPLTMTHIYHQSRQVMRVLMGDGGGVMVGENCTEMDSMPISVSLETIATFFMSDLIVLWRSQPSWIYLDVGERHIL